jgi:hypothetical protein
MEISLNTLLMNCIGKKINIFKIGKNLLFPYSENVMSLEKHSTAGYYAICRGDETVFLIGIRTEDGSYVNQDFKVKFTNNTVKAIEFDNILIGFK